VTKRWSFGFRVKQWFLSPRNWDQYYEPGDCREVVSMFYAESPDVELRKKSLSLNLRERHRRFSTMN
jgi:hypothetical protein